MKFPLALDSWGSEELAAIERVIASNRYSMGQEVANFENEICRMFNSNFSIMVNSGSSANLVMLTALKILRGEKWPNNPEIIVPALSWSTTYTPLYYLGIRPVFVDIDPNTLCIDPLLVEKAITPETVAIFTVNILGQPSDLQNLASIAQANDLDLLEDNCESLGATLHGKFTGNFGLASSQSSFYSHHLSTMEGGWIQTDDKDFADICKSLRAHGWIRELDRNSQFAISTGEEFRDRFQFVLPGLNFRPLEFEGAIGLEQLKKFPQMMKIRLKNASTFQNLFGELPFVKIQQGPGTSSWFAFSLILKGVLAGKRKELTRTLFERGIECRPVIAGNFTKQPVMKYLSGKVPFSLEVANSVDLEGFYVGNHPHDLGTQLQELREVIDEFASSVI